MLRSLTGEDIVFLATDISLSGAVDWVMLQTCFGYHFMLVLEKQERSEGQHMFYTVVQIIGTRKQADNFAYRFVNSALYLLKVGDAQSQINSTRIVFDLFFV